MAKRFYPFGPMRHDAAEYDTPALDTVSGLLPIWGSYSSIRKLKTASTMSETSVASAEKVLGVTGGAVHAYAQTATSQTAAPTSDVTTTNWSRIGTTSGTDYYPQVAGESADDSRYARYTVDGTDSATLELKFAEITDPGVDTGHKVSYRYRFMGSASDAAGWELASSLYNGATKICDLSDDTSSSPDNNWVTNAVDVASADAANITDYADLRLRLVATLTSTVTQSAAPSGDLVNTDNWKNESGSTSSVYSSISGPSPSDSTYAKTGKIANGGSTTYRFSFDSMTDPNKDPGFTAYVRAKMSDTGGSMTYKVLENGVTLDTKTVSSLATTATTYTLSPSSSVTVNDWTALQGEVTITSSSSAPSGSVTLLPASFANKNGASGSLSDIQTDDSNYLTSSSYFRVYLDSTTDPGFNTGHSISVIARKTSGASASGISVQLKQGSTVVYDSRDTDGSGGQSVTSSFATYTWDIPEADAANITNYGSLQLQVLTHNSGGSLDVDLMELDIPALRDGYVYGAWLTADSVAAVDVSWEQLAAPDSSGAENPDVTEIYAGTKTKLYDVSDSSISDVSRASGYGSSSPRSWQFCSYGDKIIATNKVDPVQVRAPGDSAFSDLITSTDKPQAACCAASHRYLFLGNISYTGSPDGQAYEIWRMALDDPTDATESASTGAERVPIRDGGGEIKALTGGEFVLVWKKSTIHRFDYAGEPTFFDLRTVSMTSGTEHPRSIVQVDRDAYFYSRDGFKVVRDGSYIDDTIGIGSVNRMVADAEFESNALALGQGQIEPVVSSSIIGSYDRVTGLIWWLVGRTTDTVWQNQLILFYNIREKRWATLELSSPGLSQIWGLPAAMESSTNMSRGVVGMSVEQNATTSTTYDFSYKKFNDAVNYSASLVTKIWSSKMLAGAIQQLSIQAVRPHYKLSDDSTVNVTLTAQWDDDPHLANNNTDSPTSANANLSFWYPFPEAAGEYFKFTVSIPEISGDSVREITGLELDIKGDGEF